MLARYWVSTDLARVLLRANLDRVGKSAWFGQLRPAIMTSFAARAGERARPCLTAFLEHARDAVLRYGEADGFIAVAVDSASMPVLRRSCVGSLLPTTREHLDAARDVEAYGVPGGGVVALLPDGVILVGSRRLVEEALAPTARPRLLPEHFTLKSNEQLDLTVNFPQGEQMLAVFVRFSATQRDLLIEAQGVARSDQAAQSIAAQLLEAKAKLQQVSADKPAIKRLADAAALSSADRRLYLRLALPGSPDEQARDIETLTSLSFAARRTYAEHALFTEAQATLQRIAKSYQESLLAAKAVHPKRPSKLSSFPAVPPDVPRGTSYQSSPEDWKAWRDIGFDLSEPQYFQYEVVATSDGAHANVIARGDFDGDGVTSEAQLSLTLDPKSGALQMGDMVIKDPHE